jgi:hypothetical protein
MEYKLIKDLRKIKPIANKYNMVFDKKFKYCINEGESQYIIKYKEKEFILKYFSGCFYPYLIEKNIKLEKELFNQLDNAIKTKKPKNEIIKLKIEIDKFNLVDKF